jgi:hypothetical protein
VAGQARHQVGVGILGGPKHQLLTLQHIDKTRIAHCDRRHKLNHSFEHSMKRVSGRHPASNLMQKLDIQYFVGP